MAGVRRLALFILLGVLGTARAKTREEVTSVRVSGAHAVEEDVILEGLATSVDRPLDRALLAQDLARVERLYRSLGYYEARVTAARLVKTGDQEVAVELVVREGSPVVTTSIDLEGLAELPIDVGAAALGAITLREGERLTEEGLRASRDGILDALRDQGYAFASVEKRATIDVARHQAVVRFIVRAGKAARYGRIQILGLREIPGDRVSATFGLREGDPYSHADLMEAREAILELGVFASVVVHEDLSQAASLTVPVNVVVEEAATRVLRIGGGTRLDVVRLSTHLRLSWENRNFFGGLRHFSVQTEPGLTFYPTSLGSIQTPTRVLPENHARAELRQPAFLEGRTVGFISGAYNVYPLLYPLPADSDPALERILGYNEGKGSVGLERLFFNHHLWARLQYTFQANFPFNYQGSLPDGLGNVQVSAPELELRLSFLDQALDPHRGVVLQHSTEVAGYVFGGTVSDVRLRPEIRTYLPLAKRWTWATRATAGFLFPGDYGETLADPGLDAASTRDQQKLSFRAFYSGGPNSNRGYPLYGIGPQGIVTFLIPRGQQAECERRPMEPECRRALGGLTLLELSTEVRFPLYEPLRGVAFADMSDVTRSNSELGKSLVPHLAVGLGIRYHTPVGPLRLDAAWRVPGLQGEDAAGIPTRGTEQTSVLDPITLHVTLGEAF